MATMIKFSLEGEKAQPVFINSGENNDFINQLFGLFQTNPTETDFRLPKETKSYRLFDDKIDCFSKNLQPDPNHIISLTGLRSSPDSVSMIIIELGTNPQAVYYQGLLVNEIFVGHKTTAELAAFQSIWEKQHLC